MEKERVTKSILKRTDDREWSTSSGKSAMSTDCSDSEDSTMSTTSANANVKFSLIEIRDYDVTLGDNPSCVYGPPISLDWEYEVRDPICINAYEEARPVRRKMHQMHMLSRHRAILLKTKAGVTDDEIEMVMEEMKQIRKGRKMTKMSLPFAKLQEAAESAQRKWSRSNRPNTPHS